MGETLRAAVGLETGEIDSRVVVGEGGGAGGRARHPARRKTANSRPIQRILYNKINLPKTDKREP